MLNIKYSIYPVSCLISSILHSASSMKIAIYPGTFDPVTAGHLDILHEAASLFDHVVAAVGINPGKVPLFTAQERVQMLREAVAAEEFIQCRSRRV